MQKFKVGLEIHGYINVENSTKLFCDCALGDAAPNTNICPVCTGQPGSKPMAPNREAFDKVVAISEMLGCSTSSRLLFQRKHYDWPDLPAGYQRTISGSYSSPVGVNGSFLGIGITDVHLEEDPARWDPQTGYVDYNRSGFPLVEIVTEPDFQSLDQVRDWLKKLMTTLSYIKAIDPDAGIKADVNVSIAPDFGRVEVKNVNSFRAIVAVIDYEIKRQEKEAKEGRKILQQTRAWSEASGTTAFMRSKEQAMDYMFIPDPDLPVIRIDSSYIRRISSGLPEKPSEKVEKYRKLKIDAVDAQVISSELLLAELFEKVIREVDPVIAARWLRRELLRVLNYSRKGLEDLDIEANLIQLLKLIQEKKITDATGQKLIEKLVEQSFDVERYVKEHNLLAVSDERLLENLCLSAINENPSVAADFKSGNEKALHRLMGEVMKKSSGKATPKEVSGILRKLLT